MTLYEAEMARRKSIAAVEDRDAMLIEYCNIVVATTFFLAFKNIAWRFNLGYPTPDEMPSVWLVLGMALFQTLSEVIFGVLANFHQLTSNVPLLRVWGAAERVRRVREVLIVLSVGCFCLWTYRVVPLAGFCQTPDDVCSCSFAKGVPALTEMCFMNQINVTIVQSDSCTLLLQHNLTQAWNEFCT